MKIITDIHKFRRTEICSGTSSHFIEEIWRIFIFKKQKSLYTSKEEEKFLPFYHFFVYLKPVRKKNWKYYPQFKGSDIALQVICMSYIFANINTRTWRWSIKKLTKFLKTCNNLTTHINNIMANITKQQHINIGKILKSMHKTFLKLFAKFCINAFTKMYKLRSK